MGVLDFHSPSGYSKSSVYVRVFECQVYHNFVVLEITHGTPEFCPGATMEAMTKEPLELA